MYQENTSLTQLQKPKKKEGKISSIVLCVQFCVCRKMGFKIWHHSKAASALLREKCPNWRNLARGSAPVQKQILIFLKNSFSKPTKMQSCIFWPKPTPPPTFTRAGTKNCEFELPKKTIALQVFSQNRAMCDQKFEWTFPCFLGGLNACPDGLGYLFTTKTVILQIFSNWSRNAQPRSAWLSAGGSNRYLGNAQMQSTWTIMGLPCFRDARTTKNSHFTTLEWSLCA